MKHFWTNLFHLRSLKIPKREITNMKPNSLTAYCLQISKCVALLVKYATHYVPKLEQQFSWVQLQVNIEISKVKPGDTKTSIDEDKVLGAEQV